MSILPPPIMKALLDSIYVKGRKWSREKKMRHELDKSHAAPYPYRQGPQSCYVRASSSDHFICLLQHSSFISLLADTSSL
jgi:hypothetical protein